MKHSTLFLAALAAVSLSQPVSARKFSHSSAGIPVRTVLQSAKASRLSVARSGVPDPVWCPVNQKVSSWDVDAADWLHEETYTSEYYPDGNHKTDLIYNEVEETLTRISYEYNAQGYLSCQSTEEIDEGDVATEVSRKEISRDDPRLPALITANREWVMIDGTLQMMGNNYNRNVKRNDAGNITEVEIATYYDGAFDPSRRMTVTYGEDGKATEIVCTDLSYDWMSQKYTWIEAERFSDIVWENTDGQIFDTSYLFSGANRIKSAKYTSQIDDYEISVEYEDNSADYVAVFTGVIEGIEATKTTTVTILDEYGSASDLQEFVYIEDGEEFYEGYIQKVVYDKWGYDILFEDIDVSDPDFPIVYERQEAETEYDPEYGYPTLMIIRSYDMEAEEMVNFMKLEFSDYKDVAGIENIAVSDADETPVYYNLQGMRIKNPSAGGVYIVRRGNSVSKVVIR